MDCGDCGDCLDCNPPIELPDDIEWYIDFDDEYNVELYISIDPVPEFAGFNNVYVAMARYLDEDNGRYGNVYVLLYDEWRFVDYVLFDVGDGQAFAAYGIEPAFGGLLSAFTRDFRFLIGSGLNNPTSTIGRNNADSFRVSRGDNRRRNLVAMRMRHTWVYGMAHLYIAMNGYDGLYEAAFGGYLRATQAGISEGHTTRPSPYYSLLNQCTTTLPGFIILDYVMHNNRPERGHGIVCYELAERWGINAREEYELYLEMARARGEVILSDYMFFSRVSPFWEAEARSRRFKAQLNFGTIIVGGGIAIAGVGYLIAPAVAGVYYKLYLYLSPALLAAPQGVRQFIDVVGSNQAVLRLCADTKRLLFDAGLFVRDGALKLTSVCASQMRALAEVITNSKSSVWSRSPIERGRIIEQLRGAFAHFYNFPVIDKFVGVSGQLAQSVTSIKSVDLKAMTYQSGNALYNRLMAYSRALANFQTTTHVGIQVIVDSSTAKFLELVVPPGATPVQLEQINRAVAAAADMGVELIKIIMR